MQFDRKITISAGSSRRAMVWQAQTLLISELWAKLQTPARGTEPLAEYLNMKKAQQDDLKDVGGFMAGTLSPKAHRWAPFYCVVVPLRLILALVWDLLRATLLVVTWPVWWLHEEHEAKFKTLNNVNKFINA